MEGNENGVYLRWSRALGEIDCVMLMEMKMITSTNLSATS